MQFYIDTQIQNDRKEVAEKSTPKLKNMFVQANHENHREPNLKTCRFLFMVFFWYKVASNQQHLSKNSDKYIFLFLFFEWLLDTMFIKCIQIYVRKKQKERREKNYY